MSASCYVDGLDFAFFLKPIEHFCSIWSHFIQVWPTLLTEHTNKQLGLQILMSLFWKHYPEKIDQNVTDFSMSPVKYALFQKDVTFYFLHNC